MAPGGHPTHSALSFPSAPGVLPSMYSTVVAAARPQRLLQSSLQASGALPWPHSLWSRCQHARLQRWQRSFARQRSSLPASGLGREAGARAIHLCTLLQLSVRCSCPRYVIRLSSTLLLALPAHQQGPGSTPKVYLNLASLNLEPLTCALEVHLTWGPLTGALGVLGDHVLAACPEGVHCLHWPSAELVQSLPFPPDARPLPGQLLHAAQAASGTCMCLAGYHLVCAAVFSTGPLHA